MTTSIFNPTLAKGQGDAIHWGNLHGSSLAMAIANAASKTKGPILLVTADTPSAMKLEKELSFFLLGKKVQVQLFPDWETLPYDNFSPHQDIISQRLETLYRLTQAQNSVFIVPVNTLMLRMAPVDYLSKYLLILKVNQTLDIDAFRLSLERAGYQHVNQVMGHSEFSIRGSIIDLFPMGSQQPFRIDLFDNDVDSIRYFDPDSQRSGDKIDEIKLLPAREFPTDKDGIALFRQQYLERFDPSNAKESLYYQVGKGMMPGGIEYYLPLFFAQTATLFDYLHPDTLLMLQGDLGSACEFFWTDVNERYEQLRYNLSRPLMAPADLFLRHEELFAALKKWPRITIDHSAKEQKAGVTNFATRTIGDIAIKSQNKVPWATLKQRIADWQKSGSKVLFSAESQGRRESLLDLLTKAGIKPKAFDHLDAFHKSKEQKGITIG
ncbi:MAG: transcription-repair coupling factor, partial [Paraglaciecola polaris]